MAYCMFIEPKLMLSLTLLIMYFCWIAKALRSASFLRQPNKLFELGSRGFSSSGSGDNKIPSIDAFAKGKRLSPNPSGPVDLAELARERKSAFTTLSFPVPFKIKIIGVNDGKFQSDVLELVGEVVGTTPSTINTESKMSGGNKFLSVTVTPTFSNADQILEVYKRLGELPSCKFVL